MVQNKIKPSSNQVFKGVAAHHDTKIRQVSISVFAIAILIAVSGWWSLDNWLVDDAGISLAYAKNLVQYGSLIAQLGQAPVEGYSNPLWVGLLALAQWVGFDIRIVPIISGVFVAFSVFRLAFFRAASWRYQLAFWLTAILVVMQPSVLIWSFSGLENALVLAAGTELLLRSYATSVGNRNRQNAIAAGIAVSVLSLVRPEGIFYVTFFPCVLWCVRHRYPIERDLVIYSVALPIVAWSAYEMFRRVYFGEWVPNTYYAKGGLTVSRFLEIASIGPIVDSRLRELADSLFGWAGAIWATVLVAILARRACQGENSTALTAPFIMMLFAITLYLLMPGDWMGEQRFATLFYPPAYLFIALVILISPLPKATVGMLMAALLIWSGWQSIHRIDRFLEHPVISVKEVEARSVQFESWASRLEIHQPSLMTADVGGLLLRNKLQIIDLGMLSDRTIALALGEGSPQPNLASFHNYVFDSRKPDFIATRAYHSWIARLDDDPRFRRDYVPIREYIDQWILRRYGEERLSGDYVRRDRVSTRSDQLQLIQVDAAKAFYPFCNDCPEYESRHTR